MKNILLLLTLFLSGNIYSQFKTVLPTYTMSTAKMTWNNKKKEYDFKSNKDEKKFYTEWSFNINEAGLGTITNGKVNYTITKYTPAENDIIILQVFNSVLQREVIMMVRLHRGEELELVVFDKDEKITYYFF